MTTGDDSPVTTNMADDEEPQPEVLQPCAVCGRKFISRSLDKHVRICERTNQRKRKPFDSSKQRIQGTELAEFLPKQHQQLSSATLHSTSEPSRNRGSAADHQQLPGSRPNQAWKQTRDEFLRAIRAARGDSVPARTQQQQRAPQSNASSQQQIQSQSQQQGAAQQRPSTLSLVTATGAPTRPNEKGTCPTCHRQFGLKSYDRHVAFCRERATRLPASPQTSNNVAKERLDARMKYRAPGLKNRKPTNREKYSPGASKVVQSPLMARANSKEQEKLADKGHAAKSEINSPKLPTLKRPGQVNKDSQSGSNVPLKSRPIDRSNRSSDPQDSLNTSDVRQIFASRRLMLFPEVLPSKNKKVFQSATSSQKSSARVISNAAHKEIMDSPVVSPKSTDRKVRKKLKLKQPRELPKQKQIHEDEIEIKQDHVIVEKLELLEESHDFVTWKQIRESNVLESIEREEEPVFSDINGLSSLEEENSNDDYDFSRKASSRRSTARKPLAEAKLSARKVENESTAPCRGPSLDQTYQIRYPIKLEDLELDEDDSTVTLTNKDNNIAANSDDNDDSLSAASKKTFRKSDRKPDGDVIFIESLDLYDEKADSSENKETEIVALEETEISENSLELMKKMQDKSVTRPPQCHSMPTIGDTKAKETSIVQKAEKLGLAEKEATNLSPFSPVPKSGRKSTPKGDHSSRRCATYVIHDSTRIESPHQYPQHTYPDEEERSEEKPIKNRQAQHTHEPSVEQNPPSKNEKRHGSSFDVKKEPSTENKVEGREQSLVVVDYYRNEAANFSEVSSARTDDQMMMIDLYDDFVDENESNASDLIKEIDVSMINPPSDSFVEDSEDALMDLANRLRGADLMRIKKPRNTTSRRRNVRFDGKYRTKTEEVSTSTIELANLSSMCGDGRPSTALEKEICTITRLDQEEPFLPSIGNWRSRFEYHREKLVKKKRHDGPIIKLDTPRDVDSEREERDRIPEEYPQQHRLYPPMRRLLHHNRRSLLRRSFERLPRSDWNNYIRRHPDFSMILRGRIGVGKDYNPFLLAEQQLNDLFSDTSDQSSIDGSATSLPQKPNSSPNFPLSHSSAFVKYPANNSQQPDSQPQSQSQQQSSNSDKQPPQPPVSLIAPPTGFDDLTSSDLSSDCTETNSVSRELLTSSSNSNSVADSRLHIIEREREHVLGRRVIINQNQALGGGEFAPPNDNGQSKLSNSSSRLARPIPTAVNGNGCNRSSSMRSSSAPKPPERKISSSSSSGSSDFPRNKASPMKAGRQTSISNDQLRGNNNYKSLNGSNLSLSSMISSTDLEMKRSNSLFDELLSSFEDDANSSSTLPSLISLMRNDHSASLLSSTPQHNGVNGHHHHHSQRGGGNGRINCSDEDAERSSPESVKRQECGKLSADSAYSSLNRKYSNHGRSTNEISNKYKLSKFCYECGFKFPDLAKFCCECGVKRLTL